VYSAQPSTCQPMFHCTATGKARMKMVSKIANFRRGQYLPIHIARAILYQQSPCHCKVIDRRRYSDPLLEDPRDRRLLQKVHGACDKDPQCAYSLTPYRELYRSFKASRCIFPEQWDLVDGLTGHGQLFLSFRPGPPNFLCHPVFILRIHAQYFLSGDGSGYHT
jgi:hypothetical protein